MICLVLGGLGTAGGSVSAPLPLTPQGAYTRVLHHSGSLEVTGVYPVLDELNLFAFKIAGCNNVGACKVDDFDFCVYISKLHSFVSFRLPIC